MFEKYFFFFFKSVTNSIDQEQFNFNCYFRHITASNIVNEVTSKTSKHIKVIMGETSVNEVYKINK